MLTTETTGLIGMFNGHDIKSNDGVHRSPKCVDSKKQICP